MKFIRIIEASENYKNKLQSILDSNFQYELDKYGFFDKSKTSNFLYRWGPSLRPKYYEAGKNYIKYVCQENSDPDDLFSIISRPFFKDPELKQAYKDGKLTFYVGDRNDGDLKEFKGGTTSKKYTYNVEFEFGEDTLYIYFDPHYKAWVWESESEGRYDNEHFNNPQDAFKSYKSYVKEDLGKFLKKERI